MLHHSEVLQNGEILQNTTMLRVFTEFLWSNCALVTEADQDHFDGKYFPEPDGTLLDS